MSTSSFIPYAHQSINQTDIEAVSAALQKDLITRGTIVEAFEEKIKQYCGAKYAVAFNSASTALFAACFAAETSANDRLLTTPNTFISSVTSAVHFGATPVFIDIDRNSGNFDLDQLALNLKNSPSRGKNIIIPVHFGGTPVDMQTLDLSICSPDTIVIEDAAHAIGSSYKNGQKIGSCPWSQMTVFSFHPAKTITTGEGGMVLTNDEYFFERLRLYRSNGIIQNKDHIDYPKEWYPGYYESHIISGNFNFTEFQAALGISQLERIEAFIAKRRILVQCYRKLIQEIPFIKTFTSNEDSHTAYHLFVVQIDFNAYNTNRTFVMEALNKKGIGTQVHYIPVYRHPYFRNLCGDISSYFPEMEKYYEEAITLPLYYDLLEEEVEFIVKSLKEILLSQKQKNEKKRPRW